MYIPCTTSVGVGGEGFVECGSSGVFYLYRTGMRGSPMVTTEGIHMVACCLVACMLKCHSGWMRDLLLHGAVVHPLVDDWRKLPAS